MKTFLKLYVVVFCVLFVFTGCSHYSRGKRQSDFNNYQAAISSYQEALKENPDHIEARRGLAWAYFKIGRYDPAIAESKAILADQPGDPDATLLLGVANLENGNREEAIRVLETYKNPQDPEKERAVHRQLTLLQIGQSVRLARQAIAEEQDLQTTRPSENTVAVFYYKDLSADKRFRYLQKALAELIITDLSQISSLDVLERTRVQFLLEEMKLGQTGIVDPDTAPRAGRLLGAENLIVGALAEGSVEVQTSVASTTQNDVVGGFKLKGEMEQFFDLQKQVVYNAVKVLQVSLSEAEQKQLQVHQTTNIQAVVYFGEGLDALDSGNWAKASNAFDKAVLEDPGFTLARRYRDASPPSYAPAINQLAEETNQMVADRFETANQRSTIADQREAIGESDPNEDDSGPGAGGVDRGSVGISW